MGLIVKGLAGVKARISRSETKVLDGSLRAMRAMAELVATEARRNAPVDTGDLESAIVVVEEKGIRNSKGQFSQSTIRIGVDVEKLDLESNGGYDYSIRMHDDPTYELGPRSRIKQDVQGNVVGYQYLKRALKDNDALVKRKVAEAVERGARE